MHVVLTVVAGPHTGQTYTFDRHEHFLVGRANIAHFQLPEKDPFFSRLHFMIELNPPACRLVDLKSTNGTIVNGRTVESCDLRHGDVIEAGDTILRVSIGAQTADGAIETALKPVRATPAEHDPSAQLESRADDPRQASPIPDPYRTDVPPQPIVGWQPPGYLLESRIGAGGMGEVYRARRTSDGEVVAVKVIKPAVAEITDECTRFLREVDVLRQLDHPHIVKLLDAGEHAGRLYFVMEHVDGSDLLQWMRARSSLPSWPLAIKLMLPILDALHYAHERGFVHRDVKPGNILIGKNGKRLYPKLGDFGLARAYQESQLSGLTLTGDLCGTPWFLSPEQIVDARRVQPATDQYSAAAVLYFLSTGHPTHDFTDSLQETLKAILLEPPVPIQQRREDAPVPLTFHLHRVFSKEPSTRFSSISELREALGDCLRDL